MVWTLTQNQTNGPHSCICNLSSIVTLGLELLQIGDMWCCDSGSYGVPAFILGEIWLYLDPNQEVTLLPKGVKDVLLIATAWRNGGGAVVNCIVNAVRALSHITTLKLDNQSRHLGFYRMCYSSWLKRLKNRPGFLNLRTIDILSRTILCCGGCPNHCSGWPASLPSTNQMSAYPLSIRDNQNCPRALSNVFWG